MKYIYYEMAVTYLLQYGYWQYNNNLKIEYSSLSSILAMHAIGYG